jgi:hypothetical protein
MSIPIVGTPNTSSTSETVNFNRIKGYNYGGYTTGFNENEIAGVVHGGEYVVP